MASVKKPHTPPKMHINLDDTRVVECACGASVFMPAMQLRYVSPLQSPTGEPTILELPVKVCGKCGKVYTLQGMLEGIRSEDAKKAAEATGILMPGN